jgi:uncharacterized protein
MPDLVLIFTIAVFALAGFVKGVIGLGLPTISMGLLVLAMTPVQAAALLIVPSLVTNIWQMLAGRRFRACVTRLWPMMAAICIGTWLGPSMPTASGGYAMAALGAGLIIYALAGLSAYRMAVRPEREIWLSPAIGVVTGAITAATGVFVIPAVPYLQGLGLDKDELVQALGLSFTVSTVALAGNLIRSDAFTPSMAGTALIALGAACVGMVAGQAIRDRLSQDGFRRWFFVGLLALGGYISLTAIL